MKRVLSLLLALVALTPLWAGTYTRVEVPADLESGAKYLIVYETGSVIFDGSLTTLDADNNCKSVTISDNTIEVDDKYYFVITKTDNMYTIQSASGYYIYWPVQGSGLETSTSECPSSRLSSVSIYDDYAKIGGLGNELRYDTVNMRFRYYASYSKYQTIRLYKRQTVPTLKVSEESLTLTKKRGEEDPMTTFDVTFWDLTGDIAISCDNSNFTVSPSSISSSAESPQTVTVTFTGTADATGTITVTDETDGLTKKVVVNGYYEASGTLKTIEAEFDDETQVTVADELQVMWVISGTQTINGETVEVNMLFARDLAQSNYYSTNERGATDYLDTCGVQKANTVTQNNWVALTVMDAANAEWITKFQVGDYIKAGTITGTYYAGDYSIKLMSEPEKSETAATTAVYNQYIVPNFFNNYLTGQETDETTGEKTDKEFFFMDPKICEVAHLQWMMWNGSTFVLPTSDAQGLNKGVVVNGYALEAPDLALNWSLNDNGDGNFGMPTDADGNTTLQTNYCYEFMAVNRAYVEADVEDPDWSPRRSAPRRASGVESFVVSPLNVTASSKPTSLDDVLDQLGREPIDVTYYNIAGQASTEPYDGFNIVVKRYSDGTTTSTKVIK